MAGLPLPTLFARALSSASKASELPTVQDETQDLLRSALSDLRLLEFRINSLSLFSFNDALEDISTRDLIYFFVSYAIGEVGNRMRITDRVERMSSLNQSQRYLNSFISTLDHYDVVPDSERALFGQNAYSLKDPPKRREMKIKQYQKEKELKSRIEIIRRRRGQQPVDDHATNNFDLIASLLSSPPASSAPDDDEDDSETDEILRETTILLLRLSYAQTHAQLESMNQEVELLRQAPSSPPSQSSSLDDERHKKSKEQEDMWRLDAPVRPNAQSPLLDAQGKPLRPFTILPAGASDRARLQAQVFGPGHRLPTMSVDEYLEIERQRGKFISGGGPASEAEPTSSERLTIDAEMDGSSSGEANAEEKRIKDEKWAQFTDANPRGAGNTMNRG